MEGMKECALYFKTFIFYVTNQAILDTNQAQSRVFSAKSILQITFWMITIARVYIFRAPPP